MSLRFSKKTFLNLTRLYQVFLPYKKQLILGVLSALFVSLLNLIGIASFAPLIDLLTRGEDIEIFVLAEKEKKIIENCVWFDQNSRAIEGDNSFSKCVSYPLVKLKEWLYRFFSLQNRQEKITTIGVAIIFANLLKIIFLLVTVYLMATSVLKVARDLRLRSYDQLLRLPLSYFHRRHTGRLMNRVVGDSETIANVLGVEFSQVFVNIFYIVTHLTFLLILSWKSLLAILFVTWLLYRPVVNFAKRVSNVTKVKLEELGNLGAITYEIISGIRIIRAFGKEGKKINEFQKTNYRLADYSLQGHYYSAVGPAFVELVSSMVFLFFILLGTFFILKGQLTQGTFFSFLFGLIFVLGPLKRFTISMNLIGICLKAIERIFKFIYQPTDIIYRKSGEREFPRDYQQLKFVDVSCGYSPNRKQNTLHNINLTIKQGEKIGLIGRSGAGKSTLIDLLMSFIQPNQGEILFPRDHEKIQLQQISTAERSKHMIAVFQDPFLFHGTIRENLVYGCPGQINDEQIMHACSQAMIDNFIRELPRKYDTSVGERGLELSGGQRQRIALARIFLLQPLILVLDEATCHLDTTNEKKILANLLQKFHKISIIMSSHRIDSIRHLDRLIVIDKGRIVENGRHEELLRQRGIYYSLYTENNGHSM